MAPPEAWRTWDNSAELPRSPCNLCARVLNVLNVLCALSAVVLVATASTRELDGPLVLKGAESERCKGLALTSGCGCGCGCDADAVTVVVATPMEGDEDAGLI